MDDAIRDAAATIFAARDRERMAPTIAAFEALAAAHPDEPELVYEVAGAYDTAGEEARARALYEQALEAGLDGDVLKRCLIQYGSTLRNLGEIDASLDALDRAAAEFPESAAVRVFRALTLAELGRAEAAVGTLLTVVAEHPVGDAERYRIAIGGYAAELLQRDEGGPPA